MKNKVEVIMLPMERMRRCSFSEEDCRKLVWKRKIGAFCGMASPAFMICLPICLLAFWGSIDPSNLVMLPLPFIPALFVALFLQPSEEDIRNITKRWEKYETLFATAEAKGSAPEMTIWEISHKTNVDEAQVREDISWMQELGLISRRWYNGSTGTLYLPAMSVEEYEKQFPEENVNEEERTAPVETEAEDAGEKENTLQADLGDYAKKIAELNRQIRDKEMSRKLSTLETTVSGIQTYIEKHPENQPRADKLSNYYLPTMLKLLGSYAELEEQPVKTRKTEKIKEEICKSVDTMNKAVKSAFTQMLEDTETDITSDISAMTTKAMMDGFISGEMSSLTRETAEAQQ